MLPVVCGAGESRSLVYRRQSQSKLFGLLYRGAFRMSLEDSAQTDWPPRANDVYTTFRRGFQSAEDRKKIGAVMMAQAMEDMGVGVTSSVPLPNAVAIYVLIQLKRSESYNSIPQQRNRYARAVPVPVSGLRLKCAAKQLTLRMVR